MRDKMRTPWSDELQLVKFDKAQDDEGYILPDKPDTRCVFCTWEEGTSQNEFYMGLKSGLRVSSSVELWTADYHGERYAFFGDRFFRVVRTFASSFDHTTLILEEVER